MSRKAPRKSRFCFCRKNDKPALVVSPGRKPSLWTRADALKINATDPTTTQPLVSGEFKLMSETLFIWDTMPLRTYENQIASINGWNVIFTLAADRHPDDAEYRDENGNYDIKKDWENRHGNARMHYWYSRTGKDWIYGGRVMKPGVSPTEREWAGTPILLDNNGNVALYYTAVTPGATVVKVNGKLIADEQGVRVEGFTKVKSLFEADGKMYQTEAQNPYWGFRDPAPYRDPISGRLIVLFEGNVAGVRGSHVISKEEIGDVPPGHEELGGSRYQTACVGIAVANDDVGDSWTMYPPLVTAVGVNDQTERPHFVFHDGKYYLMTISHKFTFGDGVTGPDGVYGFVADELFGEYTPMNASGLVLGNPPEAPYQTYSHYVFQQKDGKCLVTSFIDSVPTDKETTGMDYRIGGTEAPTVAIQLVKDRSFVTEEHDFGYIPANVDVAVK